MTSGFFIVVNGYSEKLFGHSVTRIYICLMNEKRIHRSYKACDKLYNRAMVKAQKDNIKVAQLVEHVLDFYGGYDKIKIVVIGAYGQKKTIDIVQHIRDVNAEP